MKHSGLKLLKNSHNTSFYYDRFTEVLKEFFRANFKFAIFTPRNAINYSQRLSNGESFLLNNRSLYPYSYTNNNVESINQPVHSTITLSNFVREAQIYKQRIEDPETIPKNILSSFHTKMEEYKSQYTDQKDISSLSISIDRDHYKRQLKECKEEIIDSLEQINMTLSVNNTSNFVDEKNDIKDLPVSVYSRIIFVKNSLKNIDIDEKFISEDTYKLACQCFINKLEFCDSESLGLVIMSVLNNNTISSFSNKDWNSIFSRLDEVKFEREFTRVKNISPHLFRYKETAKSTKLDDLFDVSIGLSEALMNAAKNNSLPGISKIATKFNDRL